MENLIKLDNILQEIANTSGKNDKQKLIKENLDDKLFVETMKFLLNSFIITGISKKKYEKKIVVLDKILVREQLETLSETMQYFTKNNSGKDIDILVLREFVDNVAIKFGIEVSETMASIIRKDLKIGVSDETWNKVCKETDKVPTFSVMLAKNYIEHMEKVKGIFIITQKLDGQRCIIVKKNGDVKSYTRTGQRYVGIEHIENEIVNSDMDDFVFDGEIIADFNGSTLEQYAKTTSMARKESGDKTDLKFYAFDIIPYDTFFNDIEREDLPCYNRKIALANYIDRNNFNNVVNVPMLYFGDDIGAIETYEEMAVKNGWEGIMINLNKPYVRKRTDRLLKNKKFKTCDIRIIGFEEGSGRLKGTLGNLICDYKGNNVGVGSGFSYYLREDIWSNQDKWLNKIVEIKYFEVSKDSKTSLESLRFPVFVRDRSDEKDEPSYN